MSLGQREFGNIFTKEIKKEMSNKHIELSRSGNNIKVTEYLISGAGIQMLSPMTYPNSKIKFTAGRCMVMDIQSDIEYYDCRYEDCVIKTVNQ
jgi:hypothetical protein